MSAAQHIASLRRGRGYSRKYPWRLRRAWRSIFRRRTDSLRSESAGESFRDHPLFVDDRKGRPNLPLGLGLLPRLKERIGEDQVDRGAVAAQTHALGFATRFAVGLDRFADLPLLAEDVSDAPAKLDETDLAVRLLQQVERLPAKRSAPSASPWRRRT
jgi:hypothetical protein